MKSKRILFGTVFAGAFFLATLCLADWAFVALGDSRQDFERHRVFPGILQEINETALKIGDREIRAEFLLHLGDFEAVWGSREVFERFQGRMKGLKIKYFPARGNHELAEPPRNRSPLPSIQQVLRENQELLREYLSLFGLPETYFSFDHRDLHVIVLDNSLGTFQVRPGEDLKSPQLRWLEQDLEETARKVKAGKIRHTVVGAHMPPPAPSEKATAHDMAAYTARRYAEGRPLGEESARILWEILERHRERSRIGHLFFAHDHRYASYRQRGFPVTVTGGAGAVLGPEERGGFYHYVLVLVTEQGLKERIVKAYPPRK